MEGTGGLGFLASNGKKTGDIVIDAHPESFRLEETGTRLFVNLPDKKEIEVIDAVKRTVLARWPVTSAQNNFPMALDEAHHRQFVGCWVPPRLLVFDTETGKEVTSGEIAGSTDDLFYDPNRSRIYIIGGQGFIDVLQQKDADHYDILGKIPTRSGAGTSFWSPELNHYYVAAPANDKEDAAILVYAPVD